MTTTLDAGRSCPLHYRYGAHALSTAPEYCASTLYVVGGLYGNLFAFDTIASMAKQEQKQVTICFNGDFNWFNVDDDSFLAINERVLQHHALAGNVEAELNTSTDDHGCGCAYPDSVSADVVARSNRIHAALKNTAARHPALAQQLSQLPFYARYRVGECRIGVVHGDADSLSGWQFSPQTLDADDASTWLANMFLQAQTDVFASSHTCEPVLRHGLWRASDTAGQAAPWAVINNGAAGMPNGNGIATGLITRISTTPSPYPVVHGCVIRNAYVDAIAVPYDDAAWRSAFLANWPAGSAAHLSYYRRITGQS